MIYIRTEDEIDSFLQQKGTTDIKKAESVVRDIIEDIKENRDRALFYYTKKFDGFEVDADSITISEKEMKNALDFISDSEKDVIKYAKERIEKFHYAAKQHSFFIEEDGIILGNRLTPVQSCGLYVPGGKAAYPSTALMTIIPAKVAGVKNIFVASPSDKGKVNPYVIYAAYLCGVDRIYKVGGAQAIAAFAYSTESVKKVDVIAGPGNIYVALAKKLVFGDVAIDSVAGPSEIAVVADRGANAEFIACDLLSQAEHDEMAGCYFVGLDEQLAKNVEKRFSELANTTKRSNITRVSAKNAMFFYAKDMEVAAKIIDKIAPEHLEIQIEEPYVFMNMINNSGAVFIGEYTPEPIGDYIAGPNHTLPTNHTARFASPLSADVFMKKSSIIHYSKKAFFQNAKYAAEFAKIEGLFAHKSSIEVRLNGDS